MHRFGRNIIQHDELEQIFVVIYIFNFYWIYLFYFYFLKYLLLTKCPEYNNFWLHIANKKFLEFDAILKAILNYVNMKYINLFAIYGYINVTRPYTYVRCRYWRLARYVENYNWDFISALNGANFRRNTCQSLHNAAGEPPIVF